MKQKVLINLHEIVDGHNTSIIIISEKDGETEMEKFLADAESVMGSKYLPRLLAAEIISEEHGEFTISEPMKENRGRTLSYTELNVIIIFNIQDEESQRIGYHETAHILQKEEILKAITTFYKLEKDDYTIYLEEAHAETFAAVCILKDAENSEGFARRQAFLLEQARKDEDKAANSTDSFDKYYAHYTLLESFINNAALESISAKSYNELAVQCEEHVMSHKRSFPEFMEFFDNV